jgi:hypothetical protein
VIVRAKPPPDGIAEAIEIATPLVGDIRLRLEEHEAIAMLLASARREKPSKRLTQANGDDE